MNTKLRLLLLASSALRATLLQHAAVAQELRPVWAPSKIGGNAYRVRSGLEWQDALSGGAELAVIANSSRVVSKMPVALWGRANASANLPFGGDLKQKWFARFETKTRKTTLEYEARQLWQMPGGTQLEGSSSLKGWMTEQTVENLAARQELKLKLPERGFSLSVSGSASGKMSPEVYHAGVVVEQRLARGLEAKAVIKRLEAAPVISLKVKYRRRW